MIKVHLLFILIICLSSQISMAIVGYDRSAIAASNPAAYSTVALVKQTDNQSFKTFCTGSLVAKNMVATAKHCIEFVKSENIYVYFGDNINNLNPLFLRSINHREYYNHIDIEVSFPSYDFGFVTFEGNLPAISDTGVTFKPIDILTNANQVLQAEELMIAGYGISEFSPQVVHGIKRRVQTNVRSFVSNAQFTSLFLLAGNKGEGSCYGDSGGPLYAKYNGKWFLAGAASGFDVGLTPGSYKVVDVKDNEVTPNCFGGEAVYTFVGDYVNWMEEISGIELLVSEESNIQNPGRDFPNIANPKSFYEWCMGTNYNHPAWITIRQLIYFAADAKSEYSSEEILSSCDVADKVLSTIKSITFNQDTFFADLSPLNSLKNLERLSFVKTKIPDLSFFENKNLKSLRIANAGVDSFSSVPGLFAMSYLQELDLTGNKISALNDLLIYKKLKVIKLGKNNISDLSVLAELKDLEVIEAFNNSLVSLEPILNLTQLRELLVANNGITSPENLANWPELKMAILSNNQLTNLDFLKKSKKIKRIRTYRNPLTKSEQP